MQPTGTVSPTNIIVPIPLTAPPPPDTFKNHTVTQRWPYYAAIDELVGYTCGFTYLNGDGGIHHDSVQQVYTGNGWAWKGMASPRPLYGLLALANRPTDPVLIVQHERNVDAIQVIALPYVVLTWAGDARSWRKTDWSPINGKRVLLWPQPTSDSLDAMTALGNKLLANNIEVKLLSGADRDAGQCAEEGWGWEELKQWAVPRITVMTRSTKGDSNDDDRGYEEGERSGSPGSDAPLMGGLPSGDESEAERATGGGGASPEHEPATAPAADKAVARTPAPVSGPSRNLWQSLGLDHTPNGQPLTNLDNAVRVLEHDPSLKGTVWFDDFLGRLLTADVAGGAREWSDADDINLTLYLQRGIGLTKVSRETVQQAVVAVAYRDRRNCVQDWMRALAWDEQPRMDSFFSDVFGAEDTAYTRAAARNFWVSIAARAFRPGCQLKNMIVLEGAQGLGKSPAVAIIGGDWYAAQHESATNPKAFAEVLQGKLIIEIEEMDAFSRADLTSIKRAVSCQSDRYRAAYGRHAQDYKRTIVMIGTTNKDNWNRDDTGADRFWPIRCQGLINLKLLAEIRDQLFAEALHHLDAGARYWEMPREETKAQQDQRFDGDPWLEPISVYLEGREIASVNDILMDRFDQKLGDIDKAAQMRVATCLTFLGWSNGGNKKIGGKVKRIWCRTPQSKFSETAADDLIELANKALHDATDATDA